MRENRNISSGSDSFVTPIVTNNPVFQVKILSVDDKMETKAGTEKKRKDTLKISNTIKGIVLGGESKKIEKGKIEKIEKDANGDILSYVIINSKGDKLKIDPSSAQQINLNGDKGFGENIVSSPVSENYVLLYEQWKSNKDNRL
jgi:hypothetical protein